MSKQAEFAEFIQSRIILGKLPPGEKLGRDALIDEFARTINDGKTSLSERTKTSAAAYRGAVDALARLRVVEPLSGYGTKVRFPSPTAVRAEAVLRSQTESLAIVALTTFPATSWDGIAKVRLIHDRMEALRDATDDHSKVGFVRVDWEFHREILVQSGYECALATIEPIFWSFVLTSVQRNGGDWPAKDRHEIFDEHKAVVESIWNRKAEEAACALQFHIDSSAKLSPRPSSPAKKAKGTKTDRGEVLDCFAEVAKYTGISGAAAGFIAKKKPSTVAELMSLLITDRRDFATSS